MLLGIMLAAAPIADPIPQPPSPFDADGNSMSGLRRLPQMSDRADKDVAPEALCTPDQKWCQRIERDPATGISMLNVYDGTQPYNAQRVQSYELMTSDEGASLSLWPRIVSLAPDATGQHAAFVGVETRISTGYSGGGASATRLSMIRVDKSGAPPMGEVLDLPLSGSATIRACFGADDMKQRAGACHDEYKFSSKLELAEPHGGYPAFSFTTHAESYPGKVSRNADSLSAPPLAKKDLVWVTDPLCSYHRTVRFNPATDRYEFDTPAPDCSEFTVP